MKTCHITPWFWYNQGVKCSSHGFDHRLLHFYYFKNWMTRPIFPLGYLRNRGNREHLLPRFIQMTEEKTLLFIIFFIFLFFFFELVLQNHILATSETKILYLLPISQTNILYKNYSLFTPFSKSKWHMYTL